MSNRITQYQFIHYATREDLLENYIRYGQSSSLHQAECIDSEYLLTSIKCIL